MCGLGSESSKAACMRNLATVPRELFRVNGVDGKRVYQLDLPNAVQGFSTSLPKSPPHYVVRACLSQFVDARVEPLAGLGKRQCQALKTTLATSYLLQDEAEPEASTIACQVSP